MRPTGIALALLFSATAFGQSIMTPLNVLKDGEATSAMYTGAEKELYVDGGSSQSVGWITFQTVGVDVSNIASAKLVLFVSAISTPGTLQVRPLSAAITAPENNVRLSAINFASSGISKTLGSADIETILQFDITATLKAGGFNGIALLSDDGLVATFDSKEGRLAPVILLQHDVGSTATKWLTGSGVPASSLGKNGDLYLNTSAGDVYTKQSDAWTVTANIKGATGDKGDAGQAGAQGAQGPAGSAGAQGTAGSQGIQGQTGSTGPQGAKGDKGDKGDPGVSASTDLYDSIAALRTKINELTTLLQHFSRIDNEIYITGANLNIRNGTDSTYSHNSLGNLVLGYNENNDLDRTGSHNFVTGLLNSYSSYGGYISGVNNTISNEYTFISGGSGNHAGGASASIISGAYDTVTSIYASCIAGLWNHVSGNYAAAVGGRYNLVTGSQACAIAGDRDTAAGDFSGTIGGLFNKASGTYSTVTSGGRNNKATEMYSTVSGGTYNQATGVTSTVSGGNGNTASSLNSTVSGGSGNTASGTASAISGGSSLTQSNNAGWTGGTYHAP